MATAQLRPFHETLVEAIYKGEDTRCLSFLIATTKIPRDHDAIITAMELMKWDDDGYRKREVELAKDSLLSQKLVAELKATDLASSFSDNGKERALMVVLEKIIGCLQNQPAGRLGDKVTDDVCKLFETAKQIHRAKDEKTFQAALADL